LKTIENQIVSRIYGSGRGWAFSQKDFAALGDPASIDRTLSRMAQKGTIRRVMRGLYDYPAYSKLLDKPLSPDIDQVAHALGRKFGWQIQVSGNAALNLVGLSTQVPTQYLYLSDGPSKTYQVGQVAIVFKKTRFTQLGLKYPHNEILVQAIHALGDKRLSEQQCATLRRFLLASHHKNKGPVSKNSATNNAIDSVIDSDQALPDALVQRTLKDTQYVTAWITRRIRQLLLENAPSATKAQNTRSQVSE
tara:strand:+ start:5965 stop:6711 length:747 start_codon:yes stop_codon:yes gene_type:complete